MPPPPHALIEVAIELAATVDLAKLNAALSAFAANNPAFVISTDRESGQTILGGCSEEELDRAITAIAAEELVTAVGQLRVAYRETLGRAAEITYAHKVQTGDAGQFAQVTILFEPAEPNDGYSFESLIGDALPEAYASAIEKGLEAAKENGLRFGYPVIDFNAALFDAKFHDVDSPAFAFEIAAREAFRKLRDEASSKLLEPVMRVEVATPEEFVGDVIADLNARRAMIQGTGQRDSDPVIIAEVRLSSMFGYPSALRAMSEGRATFTMQYERYEPASRWRSPPPDDTFPPAVGMRA